jgi:hypothetical protein
MDTNDGQRGVRLFMRGFKDVLGRFRDYGVLSITKTYNWVSINGDYGGTFDKTGKFVPNKICGN